MYLYVEKRDILTKSRPNSKPFFGAPIFVMLFNLKGNKSLIQADNQEVLAHLQNQGFYLQMPKAEENLLELHKMQQKTRFNHQKIPIP